MIFRKKMEEVGENSIVKLELEYSLFVDVGDGEQSRWVHLYHISFWLSNLGSITYLELKS